jgi:hypothetical protein
MSAFTLPMSPFFLSMQAFTLHLPAIFLRMPACKLPLHAITLRLQAFFLRLSATFLDEPLCFPHRLFIPVAAPSVGALGNDRRGTVLGKVLPKRLAHDR